MEANRRPFDVCLWTWLLAVFGANQKQWRIANNELSDFVLERLINI